MPWNHHYLSCLFEYYLCWKLCLCLTGNLYCQSCAGQMTLELSLFGEKKTDFCKKNVKILSPDLAPLCGGFQQLRPRCCSSVMRGNRNEAISAFPSRQLCSCGAKYCVVTDLCLIKYLKNKYKRNLSGYKCFSTLWQQLCHCSAGPEALRGAYRPGKSLKS